MGATWQKKDWHVPGADRRGSKRGNQSSRGVPRMQYRMVFHIWPDFSISTCLTRSVATVQADAAQRSFSAAGEGVVWAVMDSGINASHPHFALHSNVDTTSLLHQDFTSVPGAGPADCADRFAWRRDACGGDVLLKRCVVPCRLRQVRESFV
jgi:hypothetical protein